MATNLVLGKTGVTQGRTIYKGTLASPFDGSVGTNTSVDNKTFICYGGGTTNNPIVSVDLGEAIIISKIVLKNGGGNTTDSFKTMYIKNFKLQANNTNATSSAPWEDIFTGVTASYDWGGIDTFYINSSTAYRYYRIYVVDNWGYATYISLGEWEMYSEKYLIKQGTNYYTIKTGNYDELTTHNFVPLTLVEATPTASELMVNGFSNLATLYTSMTKGSDIFRPITKFNSVQIISNVNQQYKALGIKTTSELIISKQLISTKSAQAITKYFTDKTLVGNGNIKIAISTDNMTTWKSWNGSEWVSLTNTIADKNYNSMTTIEKTQWDTFKNEIISSGMTETLLESADFNSLLGDNFRFAFVLIRPTYSDNFTLKDLKWTYQAKDSYKLLSSENDLSIDINEDFIKITPIRDINSTVKVNILT